MQITNVGYKQFKSDKRWSEVNLLNSSGNWLIFIQVFHTIVTEFTKHIYNILKAF